MKISCAILDDYQQAALRFANWSGLTDKLETHCFDNHFDSEDELVKAIHGCTVVVIMRERTPFEAGLFARLPNLRLLITSGMRNASIDLQAAKARGVTVCGTSSGSEPPVELTWALIHGLGRHLITESIAMRSGGPWQSTVGSDLHGKQLGLLGLGKIGSKVAKVGLAFGMKVIAWSQNLTQETAAKVGVELASSKEELLQTSDIVSIHLVLGDRTRGLVGARELARMKPTALLINTSRAVIVDQEALVHALKNNQIAGAGLDVFDVEPLPAEHAFRRLPNVLATPHLGYVTESNYTNYFQEAVENIEAWFADKPIRLIAAK